MTDRELMQKALAALEWAADAINPQNEFDCRCLICAASDALRERLARQEQPCPNCASLQAQNTELDAKLAQIEQGIRQIGLALKEAME